MPAPTMLFAIGVELILVDILRYMKVPAPCRISSLPQGAPLRPGIYAYIEDICAVDGSGGTQFRQRLNLRYQASKAFREMLHRMTLFWAIGAIACSVATTIIVFTIQRDAAYVVRIPSLPIQSQSLTKLAARLGSPLPLGRCLGRHHHPLGAATADQGVRRVDYGQLQGMKLPLFLLRLPCTMITNMDHGAGVALVPIIVGKDTTFAKDCKSHCFSESYEFLASL
jgi:hypothetical protein